MLHVRAHVVCVGTLHPSLLNESATMTSEIQEQGFAVKFWTRVDAAKGTQSQKHHSFSERQCMFDSAVS